MKLNEYIEKCKNNHGLAAAIITSEGVIEEVTYGHLYKLIKFTGENAKDIYNKMPITAAPLPWMVDYSNCVSLEDDFILIPSKLNKRQYELLKELESAKLNGIKINYLQLFEKQICELNILYEKTGNEIHLKNIPKRKQYNSIEELKNMIKDRE